MASATVAEGLSAAPKATQPPGYPPLENAVQKCLSLIQAIGAAKGSIFVQTSAAMCHSKQAARPANAGVGVSKLGVAI